MDTAIAIKRFWTAAALFFAIFLTLGQCWGTGQQHPHRKHPDGFHTSCSKCPPGFGVVKHCTLTDDTVCHSCASGYYSSGHSRSKPCLPCSRCGEGLFEAHGCTATKDTVCDACVNHRPHAGNSDYERKCIDVGDANKAAQINFIAAHGPFIAAQNVTLPKIVPVDSEPHPDRDNPTNETLAESEDDVIVGVAQLATFQVVLIFTAVWALLALTCRLRICSPETTRLKSLEKDAEDGVALVDDANEEGP